MMQLKLEARSMASTKMTYLSPILAVVLTLISGMILFASMGHSPLEGLYVFFVEPITSVYGLGELAVKATPLILIAVGLAIGFKANVWNIGAEGQLVMGAIVGGGLALFFHESDSAWVLPLMLIGGMLGGMAWAAIPAFLKTRFNTSEILTSLMLTYVAILLLNFMVNGPYRDPTGYNFPESRMFAESALLPILLEGTRLNLGSLITLLILAALWVMLSRTIIGFQVHVVGQAPNAAQYAGFNHKKIVWFTFLLGGALAGLAGLMEVAGPIGQLLPTISPGYGFTAIIVAFLGRLHPVGILLAGLLMALSYLGGETAQIEMGLPIALTGVFQGLLLFFLLAADVLILYRLKLTFKSAQGVN
ncbi:ABC transporter permease [Thiosulfativibrio zosterae]|uniref:ABC transporter permease n=1 Tax=Thiosulfativibrio zosterae TaxID=2675053 RepID=A0A6F8PP44_9GAMM|nr:ABC transporter permease [Thiosulfativibrio zosterae]BBP43891.1 ABC transporter permease [Thiosulfativibrio zosterae]